MFDQVRFEQLIVGETDGFRQLARTYVGEALFFDRVLNDDLEAVGRAADGGARIAEVGAGIGLLSMLMAARGHEVTAFEPESAGFPEMRRIREHVLAAWDGPVPTVTWVNAPADGGATGTAGFDLVVCINVLEHVPDTQGFLGVLTSLMAPTGRCRVIFPNYAFPYEPHFNIPTLWSKNLTGRVWRRAIGNSTLPDPEGMWRELSWPTMSGVRRAARSVGATASFSREGLRWYLTRAGSDEHFVARKGKVAGALMKSVGRVASVLVGVVPLRIAPIVDMRMMSTGGGRG